LLAGAEGLLGAAGDAATALSDIAAEDLTGPVEYGSTDLSQAVQQARIAAKDTGGNYAEGRLQDGTIIVGRSSADLHAEQDVIQQAGNQEIVDLYSEREP
jgi:hypothetical protein